MLRGTLYDTAGDTSCSWQFYVFLVHSFLLSEISPLAPRMGWSESLKRENLKSGVFFFCYRVSLDRGIHDGGQQEVWGNYRFPTTLHTSIMPYLRWFWYSRYNFCFFTAWLFFLKFWIPMKINFKISGFQVKQKFWILSSLTFRKAHSLFAYSWFIGNFYTHFVVWAVEVKWHMVRFLCYTSFRAEYSQGIPDLQAQANRPLSQQICYVVSVQINVCLAPLLSNCLVRLRPLESEFGVCEKEAMRCNLLQLVLHFPNKHMAQTHCK